MLVRIPGLGLTVSLNETWITLTRRVGKASQRVARGEEKERKLEQQQQQQAQDDSVKRQEAG
jgi:hypothetical protein